MGCRDADAWFGVEKAYFSFSSQQALNGVDFSVRPGEIHALVGRHHEGKSTLCGLMSGRLAPESGTVVAAGERYPFLTPGKAKELGIYHVSNVPALFLEQTVFENLWSRSDDRWLGLFHRNRQRRRLARWLADNGFEFPLWENMEVLPKSQWMVVDILSRLFVEPRLLIVDEALEEVQEPWRGPLMALIRRRLSAGMSLLWVTHKIEDVLSLADRVTVMRSGNVILTDAAVNMERLNLVRLCYAQLDDAGESFADQERFQELMRYTEAMLKDLPSAIVIVDNLERVRFMNRAGRRIFGDGGRDPDGSLFVGENQRLRELLLEAGAAGGDLERHGVPAFADGGRILVDVRVQAMRENGAKVGSMLIIEDVSLREEMRQRLILSEQLASIGLLAAGVAHEVNNPLEVIGNCLNYLRDGSDSADNLEVISMMEEELGRIQETVNTLVSKSGKSAADETVDIVALVRELGALLHFHGGFRGIDFVCDGDGEAFVTANPAEIRQVFLNLIRNSIDAMRDKGGVISIQVRNETEGGGGVSVWLRDSGPGIQLDNPSDIFLPFVTTKKDGGNHQGLGLYIVYGIMERCGGTITVENRPGGGCSFNLMFPSAG